MSIYQIQTIIDGQPTFKDEVKLNEILADLKVGGALQTLSPLEYHTDRQRKWYKGICLKGLSDWSGESKQWWDRELKKHCFGAELLKRETWLAENGQPVSRLTIVGVGKKNLTEFIDNILSKSIEMNWPVTEPDSDLRK